MSKSLMGPKKATNAQIKAALAKHAGIVYLAAKELGMARQSVHERISSSPELKAWAENLREEIYDVVDGVIMEAVTPLIDKETGKRIREPDLTTVRWFADRHMRKRGYGTQVEATHKLDDEALGALVASLGGDIEKLRALRNSLNP